ncbi:hypothetical protein ABPG75_009089 [Micractinium tetrahymenae]
MSHPLDQGTTGDAWAPPLPPPLPVDSDLHAALPALAAQGRWREIASRCRQATATDTAAAMSVAAYHLLALVKLNMLEEAGAELAKLGGWDDPLLRSAQLGAGGTVVPFALRRIRAELPFWLGRQEESVARLYRLLEWCADQEAAAAAGAPASAAAAGSGSSGDATAAQRLWARRYRDVLLTLVNRHCRSQQYRPALTLLDRLLQRDDSDAAAWQEVALVQALLGDTAAAATTLQRVERLLLQLQPGDSAGGSGGSGSLGGPAQPFTKQRKQLVHRNRGLLAFLQHDYRGAAQEYQAALALGPEDAAAANNLALALMHSSQLAQGVAALEAAFRRAPAALLQEPIVGNLAAMLELGASPASLADKQRFAGWVHTAAPDDFDISATRALGA